MTLAWEERITRDGWGNEISRTEGQKFKIRTGYMDGYRASAPNTGDALGLLITTFDRYDKTFDFGAMLKLINVGQACVFFLDAYKESSPATVEHFEQNLDRALFGRQPVRIEVPVEPSEVRRAPFRLPWEEVPTGLADRERLDDYAVSWVRPAAWERRDRPYGIAVYDLGFPDTAQVVVTYKPEAIDDVLPYVNLWRDREYLDPVSDVSEQPMEHFEVEGRRGRLLSFSSSTQVLIHDGPRSWIVTMYGPQTTVAEHLDELRSFVASFLWHGEPNPPPPKPTARSKAGRGEGGSRRRRAPAATAEGRRGAAVAQAPKTDDAAAIVAQRPVPDVPEATEAETAKASSRTERVEKSDGPPGISETHDAAGVADSPGALSMAFGEVYAGDVGDGEERLYELEVAKAGWFLFDIEIASGPARYTLSDPAGSTVFSVDGADHGPFSLEESGTYRLRVGSLGGKRVRYEIRMVRIR